MAHKKATVVRVCCPTCKGKAVVTELRCPNCNGKFSDSRDAAIMGLLQCSKCLECTEM